MHDASSVLARWSTCCSEDIFGDPALLECTDNPDAWLYALWMKHPEQAASRLEKVSGRKVLNEKRGSTLRAISGFQLVNEKLTRDTCMHAALKGSKCWTLAMKI